MAKLDPRDVECAHILVEHFGGHSPTLLHGAVIGVMRPGKLDGSTSITIGYIAAGVAKCWSDGWPPFEQGKVYDVGQLRQLAGIAPTITVPEAFALPAGYRLWRPGDGTIPVPVLSRDAYHGIVGDFLDLIAGNVEAHPAAVGIHVLACFGTILGRDVAYIAGPEIHYPKIFGAVVGPSSSGGKGIAKSTAMVLVSAVDPLFLARHSIGGVGSGEVVVHEMRDTKPEDNPTEKRRIVLSAELSRVLRIIRREGSILGDILREAFDNDPLRHSTLSNKVAVSTGHHLSVLGSITPTELRETRRHDGDG